jgi:hypothetical protein
VKDRSVAGLAHRGSGGIGQSLVLGALVAVRQSDASDWVLGAVRPAEQGVERRGRGGISIIAERIVPITVHAKRAAKDDLGIVVNGVDVSTMGARFDALYLPPPSRPEKPLAVKTLIVPTSEYADGRNIILATVTRSTRSRCATWSSSAPNGAGSRSRSRQAADGVPQR